MSRIWGVQLLAVPAPSHPIKEPLSPGLTWPVTIVDPGLEGLLDAEKHPPSHPMVCCSGKQLLKDPYYYSRLR